MLVKSMNDIREREAISAYLKLLKNKGVDMEGLMQRERWLLELAPSIAGLPADGLAYREAVEQQLARVEREQWPFFLSVVREYCGHGIGEGFHEEPQVLHYDADDGGVVLQTGMAFTIEPMVNAGDYRIRTMKDGWTVKTKDRSLSAQYEHTIVVTDNGCEIMTLRRDDTIPNIITHE